MEQRLNFLRNITLRQLQIFNQIAKLGSFTKAAESLYLTQPTVSAQMKKLEQTIGSPLFEQVGRKVYLTDLARELRTTCSELMQSMQVFEDKLLGYKGITHGILKLAGVTTTEYFAPLLLGAFHQAYPNINLELHISDRNTIEQRIQENTDDFYIMDIIPESIDIKFRSLFNNEIVFVAHPAHVLLEQTEISIDQILEQSIIIRERQSGTRSLLENYLKQQDLIFQPSFEISSNEAIKRAVIANLGVGVLPKIAITEEIENGEIAIIPVCNFYLSESWYVCHLEDKVLSPVSKLFYDFLTVQTKDIFKDSLVGKQKVPAALISDN